MRLLLLGGCNSIAQRAEEATRRTNKDKKSDHKCLDAAEYDDTQHEPLIESELLDIWGGTSETVTYGIIVDGQVRA